jgi:hypothetical protein
MDGPTNDLDGLTEVVIDPDRFRESGCNTGGHDSELSEADDL